MYHVELRQFPHNFCRFNLTDAELRETVLLAWARGEWVDLGERKWNPQQATLTVLDGPHIPIAQLSMGRGWRNAARKGKDVTEQLLAAVRADGAQMPATPSSSPQQQVPPAPVGIGPGVEETAQAIGLAADSLGLEVLSRLSSEPVVLAFAWRLARERYPQRSAGDCLKLAELALGSLIRRRLIELLAREGSELEPVSSERETARALLDIDSWGTEEMSGSVLMRRA